MSSLSFEGNFRAAAHHLLRHTSLGDRLPQLAEVDDDGRMLTVRGSYVDSYLSSGERELFAFLESLGGGGTVSLWAVISRCDRESVHAAVTAFGLASGQFQVPQRWATGFDGDAA